MAQAKFIDSEEFELRIERAQKETKRVASAALRAGSRIIANQARANLKRILSPGASGQMEDAFGITPVKQDMYFNWNVHIGFEGYHEPGHFPIQLIARTFESGARMGSRYTGYRWSKKTGPEDWWRKPTPFVKPAVISTKIQVEEAMIKAADEELDKIFSDWRN